MAATDAAAAAAAAAAEAVEGEEWERAMRQSAVGHEAAALRDQAATAVATGGNVIFTPFLLCFCGESIMKYPGRHGNNSTARGYV